MLLFRRIKTYINPVPGFIIRTHRQSVQAAQGSRKIGEVNDTGKIKMAGTLDKLKKSKSDEKK
jgi:hypothetical protein